MLYPAQASVFQKPGLHATSVSIDGDVSASGLASDTTFTFYARATDPSNDGSCQKVTLSSYYTCPASGEAAISGPVTLPASGAAKAIHLTGDVLATAANQGQGWVGASVQGGASTNATLHFTTLVASVTVF